MLKFQYPHLGKEVLYVPKKIGLPCSLNTRSQHWNQSSINWSNVATDTAELLREEFKNTRLTPYIVPLYRVLLVICQLMGEFKSRTKLLSGRVLDRNA